MTDNQEYIILLTACINPNGMDKTELQNVDIRLTQYLDAIKFYLRTTSYKIVIVENCNYDFSKNILNPRIEYLFFEGNNYNRNLGKGYGEGVILKYAFENSKFINQTSIIIKISGRYQIKNINFLVFWISKIRKKNTSFVATDVIYSARFATSGCIIASKDFYENYFIPCITEINDSKKRYFEHVLFDTIKTWMKEKKYFIQYPFPVKKYGVSGTTGEMVNSLNFMRYPVTFLKFVLIQTRVKKL